MKITCPECRTQNLDSSKFCQECGTALPSLGVRSEPAPAAAPTGVAAPLAPSMPVAAGAMPGTGVQHYAESKDAAIAVVLSLILVGAGQLYNGDVKKGVLLFVAAVVAAIISFGVLAIPVWLYSMYDAYKVANREKALWT